MNVIVSCWKRFEKLDHHLRSRDSDSMTPDDFQKEAMAFANEFMVVFKDRAITPYIHTLVSTIFLFIFSTGHLLTLMTFDIYIYCMWFIYFYN